MCVCVCVCVCVYFGLCTGVERHAYVQAEMDALSQALGAPLPANLLTKHTNT